MLWSQIYRDTTPIINNKTVYELFKDVNETQESITSINEAEVVKWLFGKNGFLDFFCEDFFSKPQNTKSFFTLTDPFTVKNEKPGDIDLLIVDPEEPHKSIAFECKRIKIETLENQETKINGLRNLELGINQVNNYLKLGFHQTYLMIIILDDCKNTKSENVMLRSSQFNEESSRYKLKWPIPLKSEIGVILVRITQQTKKNFKFMCGFGIHISKRASQLIQNHNLTNKINKYLFKS
jgi:hypothetical protein